MKLGLSLKPLFTTLAILLVACPAFSDLQPSVSLEVTFGKTTLRGTDFVLQYGLLRDDEPLSLQVGIRNVRGQALSLKLVASDDLSVSVAEDNGNPRKSIMQLSANQQKWLSISLHPSGNDPVPLVTFYNNDRLFASLSFSFVLEKYRLPVQEGGHYFGFYPSRVTLCLSKPPQEYRLDCSSVRINGVVPSTSNSACGSEVTCMAPVACDTNSTNQRAFCARAQVSPGQGVILYDALLTGDYVLKEPSPRLMLLSELLNENRIRQRKEKCAADWQAFLDEHKGEPQFEIMNEAGGNVRYRSEPCESVQFSYIGLHPNTTEKWGDQPFAGVRLETSGGSVLVGVLPIGRELFQGIASERITLSTPSPSDALEIAFIRDSTYVVGTFRIGAETPDTTWGTEFSVGSTLITFDRPPRGVHFYTMKVRYLGKYKSATATVSGRIVAYQLENHSEQQ